MEPPEQRGLQPFPAGGARPQQVMHLTLKLRAHCYSAESNLVIFHVRCSPFSYGESQAQKEGATFGLAKGEAFWPPRAGSFQASRGRLPRRPGERLEQERPSSVPARDVAPERCPQRARETTSNSYLPRVSVGNCERV